MNEIRKTETMEQSNSQSRMPNPETQVSQGGSVDKIREILFGNQAKDYEKRFEKLESQLTKKTMDLKNELMQRIDTLENYIKHEIKDINGRIKSESSERTNFQADIQQSFKESLESLNRKIARESDNMSQKSTELRSQILEQSKKLTAEILSRFDNASDDLKQTAKELDDAKVNRSDLSGFFLDLAMRLSGDDKNTSVKALEE